MGLCTSFRQLLIYFISLVPLRSIFYLTRPLPLQFKIVSLFAYSLLCYTNTIYLFLSWKHRPCALLAYVFIVARFFFPLFFGAGLIWAAQLAHYSSYYLLYYVLGLCQGIVIICSIPCQGLISDQTCKEEYKHKTKSVLKIFICGGKRRVHISTLNQSNSRRTNPDIVLFWYYERSKKHRAIAPHLQGASQYSYKIKNQDNSCAICIENYEVGETVASLKSCQHIFHKQCLKSWCQTGSNACPLCRTKYPVPLLFTRQQ